MIFPCIKLFIQGVGTLDKTVISISVPVSPQKLLNGFYEIFAYKVYRD
jgi:hypothetical protein